MSLLRKSEIRDEYRRRRRSLSAEEAAVGSQKIADIFFKSIDITGIRSLNCFIPIERFNEINTHLIINRLIKDHQSITVSAPRIDPTTNDLDSIKINADTSFIKNKWEIPEPNGHDIIAAQDLDAVIVPLLAYDISGTRVGYGKGFYDRFLSRCRPDCQKIGLSFFPPEDALIAAEPTDIPLDLCITPDRMIIFGK